MKLPVKPDKDKVLLIIGVIVFVSAIGYTIGAKLAMNGSESTLITDTTSADRSQTATEPVELNTGDFAEEIPSILPTNQ